MPFTLYKWSRDVLKHTEGYANVIMKILSLYIRDLRIKSFGVATSLGMTMEL